MANRKLLEMMASAAYEAICERAMKMVEQEFPDLDNQKRLWMEAGVAAGVTASITALREAGLLKDPEVEHG